MVESWISEIKLIHRRRLCRLIVDLDIEHQPDFNYKNEHPVATLQLCVRQRFLIFQIIHAPDIPQCLEDFLSNNKYSFMSVKVEDAEKLENDYILSVGNAIDLRTLAAEQVQMNMMELKQSGLKGLSERVLGKKLEKPKQIQLSNWDDRKLSCDQVQYACLDSFVSFEIARTLKKNPASSISTSQPSWPTNNFYNTTYFGDHIRTLVTNSPSMAEFWITKIEGIHSKRLCNLIMGLDVEWHTIFMLQERANSHPPDVRWTQMLLKLIYCAVIVV
ncbi:hypothetical protein Dsin_012019 [Dipteronia sinensis]|uniref:3'-5' exonuclease domain-containing protein n=1 Tax=Dipteronia sinensis TaxID=43782 RepID=A0AAE0E7S4_9ROSI|nr:hypothetical protein Dsin_012019 [Dipteronia sinensis]